MNPTELPKIDGQLNQRERDIITRWVTELKPARVLEVGTWLGGGSTLHILKALHANESGHLWGIEASQDIYERMIANITSAGEELVARFTPIFGFSQTVIPDYLRTTGNGGLIELVFLDGGDNPMEQVEEFQLLRDAIPVGCVLLSHDAKLRKGKWLIPYLKAHDNWECTLHDVSAEGLFEARKIAEQPSPDSKVEAATTLRKLRMQPKEFLGRVLPRWMVHGILNMMPQQFRTAFTQDRN